VSRNANAAKITKRTRWSHRSASTADHAAPERQRHRQPGVHVADDVGQLRRDHETVPARQCSASTGTPPDQAPASTGTPADQTSSEPTSSD
jgi:hypothetical protein